MKLHVVGAALFDTRGVGDPEVDSQKRDLLVHVAVCAEHHAVGGHTADGGGLDVGGHDDLVPDELLGRAAAGNARYEGALLSPRSTKTRSRRSVPEMGAALTICPTRRSRR